MRNKSRGLVMKIDFAAYLKTRHIIEQCLPKLEWPTDGTAQYRLFKPFFLYFVFKQTPIIGRELRLNSFIFKSNVLAHSCLNIRNFQYGMPYHE